MAPIEHPPKNGVGGKVSRESSSGSCPTQQIMDLESLRLWLDAHGVGAGPIEAARLLAGGTQNLLLRFERAGGKYVLRRPALEPRREANRIIQREARVLRALAGTGVPHARLIAACDTADVLGVSFYVTEEICGFNATVALPDRFRMNSAMRHRLGVELVDGLAALAAVDACEVGLADFGKSQGFLERQVPRWASQLESYRQYANWPGPAALAGVAEVGAWLEAHRPAAYVPGLMHGDYHIGNVLFRHDDGGLAAILDWELSTLGDPLLDLARLLSTWPDPGGASPLSLRVEPWEGFPRREELIERYQWRTGRDMQELPWFEVLSCYKLAIILEGTHARARAGLMDPAIGRRLHDSANALIGRASESAALRG